MADTFDLMSELENAPAAVDHKRVFKYDLDHTDALPLQIPAGPNSKIVHVDSQRGLTIWVEHEFTGEDRMVSDRTLFVKAFGTGKEIPAEWKHEGSTQSIHGVMTPAGVKPVALLWHIYSFLLSN